MHIVICNERLLPRFGVDRILLIIGLGLAKRGHTVTFICLRGDREAIARASSHFFIIDAPPGLDIQQTESFSTSWLSDNWGELSANGEPKILLTGGWPFFCVASVARDRHISSAFIDAGAVPHDLLPGEALPRQRELRRVRFAAMPMFTTVFPISRFIAESQTIKERGHDSGVSTVLLAADHLDRPMFESPTSNGIADYALSQLEHARAAGCKLILALGRYESIGYKNSAVIFEIFGQLAARFPLSKLLLLAQEGEVEIPAHLRSSVISLGFISDATLTSVMGSCDLGISTSLWEGFNLPIAEMQWCGKPVVAFAIGAHPEVILHPWFLCTTTREMIIKAEQILASGIPELIDFEQRLDAFRATFLWSKSIESYVRLVEDAGAQSIETLTGLEGSSRRLVLVDCTNASTDPANPGVIRVARRLAASLQAMDEFTVIFARWSETRNRYVSLGMVQSRTLAAYDGPVDWLPFMGTPDEDIDDLVDPWWLSEDPVLLVPEVVLDGRFPERIVWARARGFKVAALLHDLIPITHAPFCSRDVVAKFPEYLQALAACDAVWANSHASLGELESFARLNNLALPADRAAIWLPAQFAAYPRGRTTGGRPANAPMTALCIASIEPRKNHRLLIEGFRKLREKEPDASLRLIFIGNRFAGADDLADWIEAVTREDNASVKWTGLISDAEILKLFEEASFTVYPSMVEGYGLPIVESLWLGCPCLCHNTGVMAELAEGGGCLTVDMGDSEEIARGLSKMVFDNSLRAELAKQAVQRPLAGWGDYANVISSRIHAIRSN